VSGDEEKRHSLNAESNQSEGGGEGSTFDEEPEREGVRGETPKAVQKLGEGEGQGGRPYQKRKKEKPWGRNGPRACDLTTREGTIQDKSCASNTKKKQHLPETAQKLGGDGCGAPPGVAKQRQGRKGSRLRAKCARTRGRGN